VTTKNLRSILRYCSNPQDLSEDLAMDFFDRFDNVLKNNFHGDFSAMVNAPYPFDYYSGVDAPVRIREIDKRKTKENGYITTPDVQLSDEPVVEPVVEATATPEQSEIDFKVIDLDEEMDKRRKNTEANNPVQPEPQNAVADTIPKPATKKSSRRGASPAKAGKATKGSEAATVGGNRQQRRAAAAGSKNPKAGNKSPRKNGNRDSGSTQEAQTPENVNLSDLDFGFRLE